jgi:hypothetical protein
MIEIMTDVAEKREIITEELTPDYIAVRKIKMLLMLAQIDEAYRTRISFTIAVFNLNVGDPLLFDTSEK